MIAQLGIAVLGVTAVWLTQMKNPRYQRFAPIFGLAGQPFWFWFAWHAEGWGVVVLCVLYTVSWGKGFYQQWVAR